MIYCLVLAGVLLFQGLKSVQVTGSIDLSALWQLGIGAVRPEAIVQGSHYTSDDDGFWHRNQSTLWTGTATSRRLVAMVVLANLAQPLLSMAYFLYNSLFTCMYAEREWTRMAQSRKGLRVSGIPQGAQRSSYFLSLPYKIGLPIITFSATLHWLVSQAIFIFAIERRGPTGVPANKDPYITDSESTTNNMHLGLGWSPMALVWIMIGFGFMLISAIAMGFNRYKTGPPLFAGSSAVLAAACHPSSDEDGSEIALAQVKWGVLREPQDGVPGHCGLSARDVSLPEKGLVYE